MLKFLKWLFNIKDKPKPIIQSTAEEIPKVEENHEQLVVVEEHRTLALVIPLYNKNAEYEQLTEKHEAFFSEKPQVAPIYQMQSTLTGRDQQVEVLAHISDVSTSRSDKFFKEAPSLNLDENLLPEESEQFENLENYMGIHIHENQEELEEIALQTINETNY